MIKKINFNLVECRMSLNEIRDEIVYTYLKYTLFASTYRFLQIICLFLLMNL